MWWLADNCDASLQERAFHWLRQLQLAILLEHSHRSVLFTISDEVANKSRSLSGNCIFNFSVCIFSYLCPSNRWCCRHYIFAFSIHLCVCTCMWSGRCHCHPLLRGILRPASRQHLMYSSCILAWFSLTTTRLWGFVFCGMAFLDVCMVVFGFCRLLCNA